MTELVEKWCSKCTTMLPITAFRLLGSKQAVQSVCKRCIRQRHSQRRTQQDVPSRIRFPERSKLRSVGTREKQTAIVLNFGPSIPLPAGISLPGMDGPLPTRRLDPSAYFTTSGDAIQKLTQLKEDLRFVALKLDPDDAVSKMIEKTALRADELMALFLEVRKSATFLETEWSSHKRLTITAKNPRKKNQDEEWGTPVHKRHQCRIRRKPESNSQASAPPQMGDDSVDVLGEVGLVLVGDPD